MNQPNWNGNILVFFKRGDQNVAYGGYRHNEPISYIDPEQWIANHGSLPVFDDNTMDFVAFASLLLPRSQLVTIQNAIVANIDNKRIELGNPHTDAKGVLVFDAKQTMGRILFDESLPIFDSLRANWDAAGLSVPPITITEAQCASLLKTVAAADFMPVKDNNAWTSGSVTFGGGTTVPGVHYALRSTMYADMGTATGDMFSTQVADITDVDAAQVNALSTFNYSEDGQFFVTYGTSTSGIYSGTIIETVPAAFSGTINYTRLNLKPLINNNLNYGVFGIADGAGTFNLSNSKFDGNGYAANGPASHATDSNMWNLMIKNMMGSWGLYPYHANSVTKYENIVFDTCALGLLEYGQSGKTYTNFVFINNTSNTDSGGTSVNCATDKAAVGFSTDTSPQINIVIANEFISTDINASNAYKVKAGGQLATNGAITSIAANTTGVYGDARPSWYHGVGTDGFYSIGADELTPSTSPAPNFLSHFDGIDGQTTYTAETGQLVTCFSGSQVSTTQTKFGSASLYCPNPTSWTNSPDNPGYQFGSNDFTIDCWAYLNEVDGAAGRILAIYGGSVAGWGDTGHSWVFGPFSGIMYFQYSSSGSPVGLASNVPFSMAFGWHHAAVVRYGNSLKMYLDGVTIGSTTISTPIYLPASARTFGIGGDQSDSAYSYNWNGWIDEVRVVNGTALWTTDFTPPTQPYPSPTPPGPSPSGKTSANPTGINRGLGLVRTGVDQVITVVDNLAITSRGNVVVVA